MNEEQKNCFKDVSKVLHKNIKPYLVTRGEMGANRMKLMYLLNEMITKEKIGADG